MPLPAAEVAATAEAQRMLSAQGSASEASSRAAPANLLDSQATPGTTVNATPLSTVAPLSTTSPSPTVARTVTATPSPATTGTPAAATSGTPSANTTGTPTPNLTQTPPGTAVAPTQTPTAGTFTPTPTTAQSQSQPNLELAAAAINLVNTQRTGSGRRALTVNPQLATAAQNYATLMGKTNYFGHTGPDGSTAESRIIASGYRGRFKGEALAAGQTTAQGVLNIWLNSPAHAAILLDANAVEIGIGQVYVPGSYYSYYWVLVTGVP